MYNGVCVPKCAVSKPINKKLEKKVRPSRNNNVRCHSSFAEFVSSKELAAASHAVVFGCGMYATLQWSYYRRLRKEVQEYLDEKEKENDKKKDK